MNGLQLIDYLAMALEADNERLYDSSIINKLGSLTHDELRKLILTFAQE